MLGCADLLMRADLSLLTFEKKHQMVKERIGLKLDYELNNVKRTRASRTGKSYESILKSIADTFWVQLNTAIHNGDIHYYLIAITSPAKLAILINYLNEYCLFTSKFLNFKDFSSCVEMMLNKEHLTIHGREKISVLKDSMNNKRTYYNWDHLDKLVSGEY